MFSVHARYYFFSVIRLKVTKLLPIALQNEVTVKASPGECIHKCVACPPGAC